MTFFLNGVEIDELRVNGVEIDTAFVDGTEVYKAYEKPVISFNSLTNDGYRIYYGISISGTLEQAGRLVANGVNVGLFSNPGSNVVNVHVLGYNSGDTLVCKLTWTDRDGSYESPTRTTTLI